MTLADDVILDDLIVAKDDLSGTDIKAICTRSWTDGSVRTQNQSNEWRLRKVQEEYSL